MKAWVVIQSDSEQNVWIEKWHDAYTRRFPKVDKNGFVYLEGFPYVHDSGLDTKERYHDRKLAGAVLFGAILLTGVISIYADAIVSSIIFIIGLAIALLVGGRNKEDSYSYWRHNEPAQINMQDPAMTPGSVGITGDMIAQYSKSQHLARLVGPDRDWMLVIAFAIISAIAGLGIGYSLAASKVGK